jgi:hypothetical protein
MDERHRLDAVLTLDEELRGGRVLDLFRLQRQQALDDLKVVLDAMVDFAEQQVLFLEGGLQAVFPVLRSEMSTTEDSTITPSSVSMGLRPISTGNSLPSLRRP